MPIAFPSLRKAPRRTRRRAPVSVEAMESRLLMATQVFSDEVPVNYPAELQVYNPLTGFNETLEVPQFNVANAVLLSVTIQGDITLFQETSVSTDATLPVIFGAEADLNLDGPGLDLLAEVATQVEFFGPGSETESQTDTDADTVVLLPGDAGFAAFIGAGNVQYVLEGDGQLSGTIVLPPVGTTTLSITTEGGGEITVTYEYANFATKSGTKFNDLNGDGDRDAGEPGLAGWTINLVGTDILGNAVDESVETDADGNYSFFVAPGAYTVSEEQQDGWFQSFPAGGVYDIILTDGEVETGNDFGNFQQAVKSGVKFNDLNGDGDRDADEPGLANWTINIEGTDGQGNVVDLFVVTDADGNYSFTVNPGSYLVFEDLVAGWKQTFPAIGAAAPNGTIGYSIVLTSGQIESGNDFGNQLIPPPPVFEGKTPGFWKNHLDAWVGFSPNQTLESVFNVPDSLGLDNATLLEALNFGGGSGVTGAARNLFRAAVAALLNSAHPNLDYPLTTAEVIAQVNAALATGDRATMLTLAAQLDAFNNLEGDINS